MFYAVGFDGCVCFVDAGFDLCDSYRLAAVI